MKKTLIASAVAAVALSGGALAQDTVAMTASELAARMDSLPQVYGNIQLTNVYSDFQSGSDFSGLVDNGSTIGVKHSHEIMNGVEGFFVAELEFDADQKAGNPGLSQFDEAYIGIRGDSFGQIWVGSDDSTYERTVEVIENTWEYAAFFGLAAGSYTTGEGDLIQYMSPSFAGLQLHGAVQVNGEEGADGEKTFPYQLAATYGMGALELALAMDSNDGDTAYSGDERETDALGNEISSNENTYGVRATYDMDNFSLTGQYQTRSDFKDTAGLMGTFSVGANTFIAAYERVMYDDDADSTADLFTVQALHNLSDHMYVYVEGYYGEGDEVFNDFTSDEQSTVAVGGTYYF